MTRTAYITILIWFTLVISKTSYATFSIVAVDPETREVGTAIATCIHNFDLSRVAKLVPNKGAVNTQSYVNYTNTSNAISQIQDTLSAIELINWLKENDAQNRPEIRQNLATTIDAQGQVDSAAYTGQSSTDYKNHILGRTYAIAGNILSGPSILSAMEHAFISEEADLSHKLMAAMQAAKQHGADSRCKQTSSASAYLGVAKPNDNIAMPFMHLVARPLDRNLDPIDELQSLFLSFKEQQLLLNQHHDSDNDGIPDRLESPRLADHPINTGVFSYATGNNLFTSNGKLHRTDVSTRNVSELVLTLVMGQDMYKLTPGKHIGFSFIDETGTQITVKDSVIGQTAFAQPGANNTGVLTAVGNDQHGRQVALLLYLDGNLSTGAFYALDSYVPTTANNRDVELPGIPYNPDEYTDSDGDGQADYLDLDSDNDGITDAVEYPGLVNYPVNVGVFSYATDSNLFTSKGKLHRTDVSTQDVSGLVLTLAAGLDMYKLTSGEHIGFSFIDETGTQIIVKDSVIGQTAFAQPGANETGVLTAVGHDQNGRQIALLLYLDGNLNTGAFYALDSYVSTNANNRDIELPGTPYDPDEYADSDGDGQANYLDLDSDNDGITDDLEYPEQVNYPVNVGVFSYATGNNLFTSNGKLHRTDVSTQDVSNLVLTLAPGLDMYKLTSGKHIGFSFIDETGTQITVTDSVIGQTAFAQPGPNDTGVLTAVGSDQNGRQLALLLYLDGHLSTGAFYALDSYVPTSANNRDVELPGTPYALQLY
ncbi:DUF1028 domain-containing protein [Shewanella sp. D64]|uniref:DUF1028 domain-containing protein n=1 Tax=unclassified Shewanella TaxID=196818 RepID=UPI0022BA3219|nr:MULTISPECIES: DUF1028 domain-containing protein [unclassified Shewanella]MEC4724612.1 DUF1028 domain-containing protein [Shewanella sp. D64]MEC4736611.1 DUF1028 domain-containing protein [Shewanella sp. E94]WBJ94717.1 DUF1028 domain-containing protein [Shewanella sp. MTB7]